MPGREDGAAGWTGRGSPKDKRTTRRQHHPMKGEIMKKQTLAAATALSLLFAASQAEALSITDTYWGAGIMSSTSSPSPIVNDGTDASDAGPRLSGDVFDPNNKGYDISAMDVSILNGSLIVKIYSQTDNYFGKWLGGTISDAPGDLFLSTTGWNPLASSSSPDPDGNGVQNYNGDGKGVGTDWNFAVVLNDLYGTPNNNVFPTNSTGTSTLYSTTAGTIFYGTARDAQEAWFAPTDPSITTTGTWSISTGANPYLTITTSLAGMTGWENVREWGLHWTMACANDVIEGSYPVPEPATALLFGAGLAGLAAFGRRRGRN